jgi:hypothetical protein
MLLLNYINIFEEFYNKTLLNIYTFLKTLKTDN